MRYDPIRIERKWQGRWVREKTYEPDLHPRTKRELTAKRSGKSNDSRYGAGVKRARKPFYNLMMFPYPSAEGLHVGNMYAFTGADIYGRFKRMRGYDVFEPIGLDGFGIHSENYALRIGKHPMAQAKISEKNFYRQLQMIGDGFAWDERLETYDPEYYKWTQWTFVQMFKRGLAYRKKQAVNWCPSCKTVLADEQVIAGKCERCSTVVVKKELEQWFFRITDYAERLLKNLETIDWSERVKTAQRNWIGRSEGAMIEFRIKNQESRIKVFTTRPDTLFGATYLVLAPEHPAIKNFQFSISNFQEVEEYIQKAKSKSEEERIAEGREKTGVELKGVKAVNPANGEETPIWVADYVLGHVGTGAIMAVPAHDQRDFEFAQKYGLPIKIVVCPHYPDATCPVLDRAYEGEGHLVESDKFNGMPSAEARKGIAEYVGGEQKVNYRLRDWLISRQRYWGPPIPLVFCENCAARIKNQESRIKETYSIGEQENPGWVAVPEEDLPVELPCIENFRPTGTEKSPLAMVESFYRAKCPRCGSEARRETDVSDTFLDSAWYFLRYPSVRDSRNPWDPAVTKRWLPVDMYIGGAEHAVLHLLYSRFLSMVFHDWGLTDFEEPFTKFRSHGLLVKDGAKMSKSRGNVVNPDDYIRAYGADALRMYLMFLGPFEQGGDFRDTGIRGITRFLERVWRFTQAAVLKNPKPKTQNPNKAQNLKSQTQKILNRTIRKVTEDIEGLQYNTAISALMMLLNEFEANREAVTKEDLKTFLKLLAPFAPHMTEELWQFIIKNQKPKTKNRFISIHREPWPKYDPRLIQQDTFELVIQVNGKVRGRATLPAGASEAEAKKAALAIESVKQHTAAEPKKVIFVPNKLINFVI